MQRSYARRRTPPVIVSAFARRTWAIGDRPTMQVVVGYGELNLWFVVAQILMVVVAQIIRATCVGDQKISNFSMELR